MLILRLIRFIMGYVSFSAQGGFPERFVNLCKRYGIALWELKCRDGIITAKTDCKSYKKIRPVARKSGMKVRITGKHGMTFFMNRHSRRIGVLIGVLVGIAVLSILSSRIWRIEVTGNSTVSSEKIISVFEQLGVKEGSAAGRVEVSAVEIEAAKMLPELSWLNINIDGCTALIEVREAAVQPEAEIDEEPCNIVASRDGKIVQLRPFSGTQEQKIGSAVLKGDLLISGINENRDLTVSFCKAEGYVVARTVHNISFNQPGELTALKKAEEKSGYILRFLLFDIPLGKLAQNGFAEEKNLYINGVTLPLGLTCVREETLAESKITLSEERASMLASLEFLNLCADEFRGLEVENAVITQNGGMVSGSFTCLENIAAEQPMEIEEDNGGISE